MPVHTRSFGLLQDGRPVSAVRLQHPHSGFALELLEYGAVLRTVEVPLTSGRVLNTVLGYGTLADYEADDTYMGAIVGRCANRIENGTAIIDGRYLQLTVNEGHNHLHGGRHGFSRSLWRLADASEKAIPSALLTRRSPDGEEGYPGDLSVRMEVAITGELSFSVSITACTTRPTLFNPTLHPYFNLDGPGTPVDEHELCIDADQFLQTTRDGIPSGERLAVASTPFDFRAFARIDTRRTASHPQLHTRGGFDHYFILNKRAACDVQIRGRSGLTLQILTNQPGVQFYDGGQLHHGSNGHYPERAGLCLEPHGFPNAANEPGFPGIVLLPDNVYRHFTQFTFSPGRLTTRPGDRQLTDATDTPAVTSRYCA